MTITDPKIALPCPYCAASLERPLSWFKKPFFTCPACEKGLSESQFAVLVSDLEREMDRNIDEMLSPPETGCGGCCKS